MSFNSDPARGEEHLLARGRCLETCCRELGGSLAAIADAGDDLEGDCAAHLGQVGSLRRDIAAVVDELIGAREDIERLPPAEAARLARSLAAARNVLEEAKRAYAQLIARLTQQQEDTGQRLREVERGREVLRRYRHGLTR